MFSSIEAYEKAAATEETTKNLGSEFDFEYTVAIPKLANVDLLLKGAFYNDGEAEGYSTDMNKFWIGAEYRFTNSINDLVLELGIMGEPPLPSNCPYTTVSIKTI